MKPTPFPVLARIFHTLAECTGFSRPARTKRLRVPLRRAANVLARAGEIVALALFALPLFAADDVDLQLSLSPGELQLVPTFEACSYYFRPAAAAERSYGVEFRRAGDAKWTAAFGPVTDKPAGIWKGSVFDLAEDTEWQIRVLSSTGAEVIAPKSFHTWSSHPPIARTIDLSTLPAAAHGLVITDQGTPTGWIKYTAPAGWRLERPSDPNDAEAAAITFRGARCVILENVTIVGGARHAILVEQSEAVRILNCDLSGWGRVGVQQFTNDGARGKYADAKGELINYDGGIHINRSARTVVERCYIHDPRHRANSWMYSHPAGPSAMFVNHALGGTVVRWNDFVGSDEHRWNDVIESSNNSAINGGFFRDSDISGNFLAFGNDDGVELEGGGMNVRFYRNKIEGTTCSISTGACILGPQFIFGNLVANPGDEAGLALWFFKNSHGAEQGGQRHFINNTLVGPQPGAYGGYGKPVGRDRIGFMRNNVFVCSDVRLPGEWARRDDFDSDLFWAGGQAGAARGFLNDFRQLGQEPHGLAADPKFARPAQGDFHLDAGSPARGVAAGVANLTAPGANLGALADDATEVPFRPLALTATPRQLNFSAPHEANRIQVTLAVPATATAAVPFEIRQNRVFTWFTVEPARGTVAPGKNLTLTVTVDPARLRGRPNFKGAFLVRTPAGLSRPVTVYAAADFREDLRPASAPNSIYLEAATLPGVDQLVQRTDAPNVTGGRFAALAPNASPELAMRFTVAHPGRYALLVRAAIGRDAMQGRTFAVTLDQGAAERTPINADYEWNTGATNFRVVYVRALGELAAGEHDLRVKLGSGEMKLNELIITENPAAFFVDTWQKEQP
jgi:hypothetical protein